MSRAKLATIFFSRVFRYSGSRSRLVLVGNMAAYLFFQLKEVVEMSPALRQTVATFVPPSPRLMMNAFCASVKIDAFMRFRASSSQGKPNRKLQSKTRPFSGITSAPDVDRQASERQIRAAILNRFAAPGPPKTQRVG